MNNPKSVSEVNNREIDRLFELFNKGIQEGRRQEVERAKNYLKRLCWNDKDIELFEKWQSRNEGSEKHGE